MFTFLHRECQINIFSISLNDSKFQSLNFINPKVVISKKYKTISTAITNFSNLMENGNIQDIDNEWRMLLSSDDLININVNENTDVTEFWENVSNVKFGSGEYKYRKLTKFVFNLMCLPHSSANVERIFSLINLNKTPLRNKLKTNTLEKLLFTKSCVNNSGNCYNFKIGNELLKKMTSKALYESADNSSDSDLE